MYVKNKEEMLNMIAKAEAANMKYHLYDSYKASKNDRNIYIVKKLREYNPDIKLNKTLLNTIRERLNGYSLEINGYLQQIALRNLSVAEIRKVIPKKNILNASSVGWLLYSGDVSLKDVDSLIYDYKYYPRALIDSISRYTDKLIKVIPYYVKGEFNSYTYERFIVSHKDIVNTVYAAKTYLEIFSRISVERIYKIDGLLKDTGNDRLKDVLVLYKCARLIKGEY